MLTSNNNYLSYEREQLFDLLLNSLREQAIIQYDPRMLTNSVEDVLVRIADHDHETFYYKRYLM